MPYSARSTPGYVSSTLGGVGTAPLGGKPSTASPSHLRGGMMIGTKGTTGTRPTGLRQTGSSGGRLGQSGLSGTLNSVGPKAPAGSGFAAARGSKQTTGPWGGGGPSHKRGGGGGGGGGAPLHYNSTAVPHSLNSIPTGPVGRKLIPRQKEERSSQYTIVFDLDETLVSNRMPGLRPATKRPHLEGLLRSLKGKAEVVLWTASIESVGRPVLKQIDPHGDLFDHAVFRNPAWFSERPNNPHTKDLQLLGRDMSRTVIIENNPFSVRMNKAHAIMVPDFDRPNPSDHTLRKLEGLLLQLVDSGKPVQQFVTTHDVLHPMKVMKGVGMRLPLSGSDPFYYITDRV